MKALEQIIEDIVRRVVREELAAATGPARLLSPQEYAAAKGCSVSKVYKAIAAGKLAHERVGRQVRIASDAVIETVVPASRRAPPRDEPTPAQARALGLIQGGKP